MLAAVYPVIVLAAIIITGNHYLLDAVAGVVVLAVAFAANYGFAPQAVARSHHGIHARPPTDDRGVSLKDSYTTGVRRAVVPLAGRLVSGGHVTPNALTLAGLVLNVATVPLILSGHFIWAAVVLLLAGVCDMLDGAVARLSEQVTPFGAFLDSTSDRLSEGVVYMAIGVWFARQGHYWDLAAVFIALMMCFLVSYTRARAEALGLECKVGLASRPERIVLLLVGLLLPATTC